MLRLDVCDMWRFGMVATGLKHTA